MILKAINFETLVKNLYNSLLECSGLKKQNVLNRDTVTGPELNKMINEKDSMSFDLCDSFILFEVVEDEDKTSNVITRENDNTISSITNYNLNLSIYGNCCHNLSQKIISNFKNDGLLIKLRELGIYVNGVQHPSNIKEYINNVLWVRNDVTINVTIRYSTEQKNEGYFTEDCDNILIRNI